MTTVREMGSFPVATPRMVLVCAMIVLAQAIECQQCSIFYKKTPRVFCLAWLWLWKRESVHHCERFIHILVVSIYRMRARL